MITPQRKLWSGWLSPKSGGSLKKGGDGDSSDGNVVDRGLLNGAASEPVTPNLDANKGGEEVVLGEERVDGAPAEIVARLERELLEYQYNMGLLLIEKQEWSSKVEELTEALADANDALKREKTTYFGTVSDIDRREESLRKALGVEKQCVHDLEKALHQIRSEYAEIKFTSDSKLAEANALVASVEEKSMEVEAKLHAADAKLAEVSRKSAEVERKLFEADYREEALRKEYIIFSNEREAQERALSNRKEDLKEWESKLHAGEERLSEGRRMLNQREERVNEKEKHLKQKEFDLIEAQKKLDAAKVTLKAEEEDVMRRLADLSSKEKELDAVKHSLETKEKDLLAFDEKLNHREKVQIQELTEEHNRLLDAKKSEFELEIEQKRLAIEEELNKRIAELEKKEAAVNHLEEKLAKKEQSVERKLESIKEKEKEYASKLKSLKDKEKSIKLEEKNVEREREELLAYKAELLSEKDELQRKKAELQEQQLKICEEIEKLSITKEERSELTRLRAELKQEMEQCRLHEELLLKENEDLRQQRESIERDWEELDKKKSETEAEIRNICDQKEMFEKLKYTEEEKLRKEKLATEEFIRRELAVLENAKESYVASMAHDNLAALEKLQNERSQMLREFEMRQQEFENEIQQRLEERESQLHEKEKSFEENRERELNNLNHLREVANRELEAMNLERIRLDREKLEVSENLKFLELNQLELRKDIDELVSLSSKISSQREQFCKERERFIAFVEKHRNCESCGGITRDFVLSDLQHMAEGLNASKLADQYLTDGLADASKRTTNAKDSQVGDLGSPAPSGTISWLRKCTSKILQLSPIQIREPVSQNPQGVPQLADTGNKSGSLNKRHTKSGSLNKGHTETELDAPNNLSEHHTNSRELDDVPPAKNSEQALPENSQHSTQNGTGRPGIRRRAKVSRTRSVKAVVEDAKNFIGDDFDFIEKNTENSESLGESSLADGVSSKNGQKRNRTVASHESGMGFDDNDKSEEHSNGLLNLQRKRRQKAPPTVPAPGGNRYNLRRPRIASAKPNGNREAESTEVVPARMRKSKNTRVSSFGSIRDDGGNTPNVPVETAADSGAGKKDRVVITVSSGEANISEAEAERETDQSMQDEVQNETPNHSANKDNSSSSSSDEDEEEESQHPGEASIGKKLWTFLTT